MLKIRGAVMVASIISIMSTPAEALSPYVPMLVTDMVGGEPCFYAKNEADIVAPEGKAFIVTEARFSVEASSVTQRHRQPLLSAMAQNCLKFSELFPEKYIKAPQLNTSYYITISLISLNGPTAPVTLPLQELPPLPYTRDFIGSFCLIKGRDGGRELAADHAACSSRSTSKQR